MKILSFIPNTFASNCYVLYSGDKGVVIDPSIPYNNFVNRIGANKIQITHVIITHSHFDHILCIDDWVQNTGATVLVGARDAEALSDSYLNCYKLFMNSDINYSGDYESLDDGDEIKVGEEIITVMNTPGHTSGSITLVTEKGAFVGDVVFAHNAIGRTDLPGGNYSQLMESIKKIASLANGTVIYPGHGESTFSDKIKF